MATNGKNDSEKITKIHDKALTVDTHCDTPMEMERGAVDVGKRNTPPDSRVDFPRMKEGGLDAIFFAVFTSQKPGTPENTEKAYQLANRMIVSIKDALGKNHDVAELAVNARDAKHIEKKGKRAIYIGMENGFPIGKYISRVKEFYEKGVRYITLCHSSNNDICDSSTDSKGPVHNGLSDFGKEVVSEMNRLGMIIDVSHISDKSFFDVIELSRAPVIASHSSVRSIAHHPRNFSDKMLKAIAKNGGVVQICLLDDYLKDPDTTTVRYKKEKEIRALFAARSDKMTDAEKAELQKQWREIRESNPKSLPTVKDCVDHIDYIKNLIGIDYVGIGSDFDGGGGLADCADVSQFPNITNELVKRGYSEEEINKIWGGNFFRVFKAVEEQGKKIRSEIH